MTPETVPALGTHRRVDALRRSGWSFDNLAQQLDCPVDELLVQLGYANGGDHVEVSADVAARIHQLWVQLRQQPGPSVRTRRAARAAGLIPAYVWTDELIDAPHIEAQVAVLLRWLWFSVRLGGDDEGLARHIDALPDDLRALVTQRAFVLRYERRGRGNARRVTALLTALADEYRRRKNGRTREARRIERRAHARIQVALQARLAGFPLHDAADDQAAARGAA